MDDDTTQNADAGAAHDAGATLDADETTPTPEPPTIWQELLAIADEHAGRQIDWPDDFADQLDHYLHGAPRRP